MVAGYDFKSPAICYVTSCDNTVPHLVTFTVSEVKCLIGQHVKLVGAALCLCCYSSARTFWLHFQVDQHGFIPSKNTILKRDKQFNSTGVNDWFIGSSCRIHIPETTDYVRQAVARAQSKFFLLWIFRIILSHIFHLDRSKTKKKQFRHWNQLIKPLA